MSFHISRKDLVAICPVTALAVMGIFTLHSVVFLPCAQARSLQQQQLLLKDKWGRKIASEQEAKVEPVVSTNGFTLMPDLGITSFSYTETGLKPTPFNSLLLSFRAKVNYVLIPGKVTLFTSVTYSGLGLSSSVAGSSVSMVWLNAGGNYSTPVAKLPMLVGLDAAYYYSMMFVTSDAFGFSNIWGLSFSPFVSYSLSAHHGLGIYYKFAPVLSLGISMANLATALGAYWVYTFDNGKRLRLTVDNSVLNLSVPASATINSAVSSSALTFSVSYSGLFYKF